MAIDFQTALGIHEQALYTRARRTEVLGANMANADTPGYKARDMDFREVLAATRGPELKTKSTHDNHLRTVTAGSEPGLKYRVPYQPSMDGNTVELHIEQANFADNAIRYQATLTFLGSKFEGIKTAITGGR